ncbi:MAG TPA: ComF family protein [Rhizomicrobium sp.]|nr:ComF family protein [Rhizomicrobium sp.]
MSRNVATGLLDLVFPPLCVGCRASVSQAGFCAECWSGIVFLDGPCCGCCGHPFGVALDGDNLCAACLTRPPAFDSARAIFVYDEKSRGAILALKHADRLDLVPGFAHWLKRTGQALLDGSDMVVPVPLHAFRLWRRRYNQSAELARRLARERQLVYAPSALVRARATASQGVMASAKARRRNVLGAFKVPKPATVAGKRVLLLDDVLTTGATAEACARALKRAGAARVDVLVLARVVKPPDVLI